MRLYYYILLALIQGLTEPLPISSSAHVMILENILKIKQDNLLIEIITNFGSLVAIIIYYFNDISNLIKGILKNNKKDIIYFKKIIIASIPSILLGILLYKFISINKSFLIIGIAFLFTSIILFSSNKKINKAKNENITYKNAFFIGLSQILALFPGISRSGITTIKGLDEKIEFETSLKFSFMLYIIISFGSIFISLFELNNLKKNFLGYSLSFFVSFITTYFSLKIFIKVVKKYKFKYFAIYCLILGLTLIFINLI